MFLLKSIFESSSWGVNMVGERCDPHKLKYISVFSFCASAEQMLLLENSKLHKKMETLKGKGVEMDILAAVGVDLLTYSPFIWSPKKQWANLTSSNIPWQDRLAW